MADKTKLTAYVDPLVHRTLKIAAAREGVRESEIVNRALRAELGLAALSDAQELSTRSADEAMQAALDEVRAYRRVRPITR